MADYRNLGDHRVLRFKEKCGKDSEIPVRHDLAAWLNEYIAAARIAAEAKASLFRAADGKRKRLTASAYTAHSMRQMMKRRLEDAGLPASSEWNELRRRSGLPRGARHEIASLAFVEAHPRFSQAHDRDLVLWLVGTHHGFGRPFFPSSEVEWPAAGEVFEANLGDRKISSMPALSMADLTERWFELSQRVSQRYGVWELARLEAILRLSDHRESQREQSAD
jgi:hypothetical protein